MGKSIGSFRMLLVYPFMVFILGASTTPDSITPSQSIRDGETLVSSGGSFEMGFFSPGNSKSRYLGIWYREVSPAPRTVAWVANRENPLTVSSGVLSITDQGVLIIHDGTNTTIFWSSKRPRTTQNPVLQLLDSGNLVVRDGNGDDNTKRFLWQSFDYPCDTLLPGMKLGRDFVTGMDWFLSSWKSLDDPAQGGANLWIDPNGFPQLVVWKDSKVHYRAGPWNGLRFSGTPEMKPNPVTTYEFVLNEREVYYKYELQGSMLSRLLVNQSGHLQRFTQTDKTYGWALVYMKPKDLCDNYSLCGVYAICNRNKSSLCNCLEGFVPKSPKDWNMSKWFDGCVRRTKMHCQNGDGFQKYTGLKWPDTSYSWYNSSMNLEECREVCLRNCSCTAYANSDIRGGGSGCLLWFDDLIDMEEYADDGQEIYVRMATSQTDHIGTRGNKEKKKLGIILSSLMLIAMLIAGLILYIQKKKLRKKEMSENNSGRNYNNEGGKEEMELPIIDLTSIVKATDNFSSNNRLGEGGFGPVYKGILMEDQEIAVKRLSKNSGQGLDEFKNEVLLIAKLQHRNLVKLLSCCIEGDERMLIYEYMPNKSLDYFIFDETRSKLLDWLKRKQIIGGIARGLLYLHQDSRLRIIHRDLKASNVLLDNELNPKISDFGLARTFGGDQTEGNTNRVVGTYGYMSPEYAVDGLFSVKSDVFSFGVLVLEIVSGKKNRGFYHPDHHHNLLGHAWRFWTEGRPLELIDQALGESCTLSEALRCIHVGLLCVQQGPDDRPSMSTVVLMLSSEISLPQPKTPGFFTERNLPKAVTSSSISESSSTNAITISLLEAR